jgi:hypothetical protein
LIEQANPANVKLFATSYSGKGIRSNTSGFQVALEPPYWLVITQVDNLGITRPNYIDRKDD